MKLRKAKDENGGSLKKRIASVRTCLNDLPKFYQVLCQKARINATLEYTRRAYQTHVFEGFLSDLPISRGFVPEKSE